MSKKIKYDEVEIVLKHKGKQVWKYTSRMATTPPKVDEETLKDRLRECKSVIRGNK